MADLTTETLRYVTVGAVRGYCAHIHRTLSGAYDCLERDRRGCRRQGGYSDRRVMRYDPAAQETQPLTDDESETLEAWRDAHY
ncbi:MAG: hypothetical protein R3258_10600 [Acidimicrobiia bacterium]|nr:hypothetical protein [Acidimicrobiia bacterium]